MVLILTIGSYVQSLSLGWGLLATELVLILLPTLLFIRVSRLPARDVLALRWPGGRLVALGALAGAGIWGLDIGLQGLATAVLGYAPQSGLALVGDDPLSLTTFVLALAVAAPLCEEALFRGYLLSAYGRYPTLRAWLSVALLFAFFHLQFSGLLGLLPIALLLGGLAQRSRSLAPSIAAHMANNSMAAALTVLTTLTPELAAGQALTAALCCLMLVGPAVTAAALWAFWRETRKPDRPAPEAVPTPASPPAVSGRAYWPLAGAGVLYVVVAGLEVVMGRFPQVLTERTLRLEPAPWTQAETLTYDMWNVVNESVGTAACTLTPEGGTIAFDCLAWQQRFEVKVGNSQYAGGRYELRQSGHWDAATMQLLDARLDFAGEYGGWSAEVAPQATGLGVTLNGAGPAALPADAVMAAEWPLRLMALPFGRRMYFGSQFSLVELGISNPSGELTPSLVLVKGEEDLRTPSGADVPTYKVVVGQQTAWYTTAWPHTLLRYNDGYGVTWTLREPAADPAGN